MSGAPIRYVVGESLKSHWLIISRPDIAKPEDLRGKTLAYGRAGSADYDEGAAVMLRVFKMEVGKDYKVISFQGESERVPALLNGDVDAILVSVPNAPKALNGGMKVLVRVSDYIQRAGGAFWTRKEFVDQHPDTVKRFVRAIARGVMFYRDNKAGSFASLKEHLGIDNDKDAGIIWEETHNTFGAELPPEKFSEIFESRRQDMIAAKQWAPDNPLPDPEQFLTRDLLDPTLKDMNYVPTKLDAATH
jgi:ABC-type nitrate/sulfonate/bicarbonate transport system substrate-binding protein